MREDVGEVELALGVVGVQPAEAVAQGGGVEGVDAGVDLADGALGVGGVLLLDDAARPSPSARRARSGRSRWGRRATAVRTVTALPWPACVASEQARRVSAVEQRDVAVGDDDRAVSRGRPARAQADRVAGAELLVLDRGGRPRAATSARCAVDLVAAVPDDDDQVVGLERLGGGDRVVRPGCGRRRRAGPSGSTTSSGCPRQRRGRPRRPVGRGSRGERSCGEAAD